MEAAQHQLQVAHINFLGPATLKIFNAKVSFWLLFGIQVCHSVFSAEIEEVQTLFLYKIFGLPHCILCTVLHLEYGQFH